MSFNVYQSKEYRKALEKAGKKIIDVGKGYFAIEREISVGVIKKKIIEARGNADGETLDKFREIARNYFYGTISGTVVDKKDELFEELDYEKVCNYTILIDLKKNVEELWKNCEKKSIRWGVKTAEKNNLKIEIGTAELDDFYKMYVNTAKEGRFKPASLAFIKELLNGEIAKLFVVKKPDEEIIAGGIVLIDKDNNYLILDLTSMNESGMKLQAMPFLYWGMVKYGKSLGLNYFDLGGYDKEARKGDKTYNINKFKERFGGEVVEQPIYATNPKYGFFRGAMRKLKYLKKVYEKK